MSRPLIALAVIAAASGFGVWIPSSLYPLAPDHFRTAMRVAKDPVTGQLVTPEHTGPVLTVEAMQALARLEAAGLVTLHNADGSETLNHEGRFTDFSVIRVGPDGKRVFQCAHGRFGMEHALRHTVPATSTTEDR